MCNNCAIEKKWFTNVTPRYIGTFYKRKHILIMVLFEIIELLFIVILECVQV